jgi:hypothetical protein
MAWNDLAWTNAVVRGDRVKFLVVNMAFEGVYRKLLSLLIEG